MDCIFCKIASGALGTPFVHEDEVCVAFHDLNPQAPTHVLLIPRRHIESIAVATPTDAADLGHLMTVVPRLADALGIAEGGFRAVLNAGADGGQTVDHLHIHILGGRRMTWPPG